MPTRSRLVAAVRACAVTCVLVLSVVACGEDEPALDSSGSSGPVTTLSSQQTSGIATFYDYSGSNEVACSFDVGADTNITAINDAEYAKAASCGSCLAVSGPKGKVTVRIVDRCPGCKANHLDLSAEAFAKIAEPKAGRVPITYQLVSCDVPAKMSYRIKEGSSKFWTAIQVRDHRIPITKVEYKKNGVFMNMPRSDYNYFIDTKGVGDQPSGIAIRITGSDGQVVEDTIPAVKPGEVFPGDVQFK